MIIKMFLINTFIDGSFSGGQALVAVLRQPGQTSLLKALASELKAPVTAYVLPYPEGFAVRYFSLTGEMDSGGYAALAVAKALYSAGLAPPDQPLRLEGLKGPALVRPASEPAGELSLILPAVPAQSPPAWAPKLPAGLNQTTIQALMAVGAHRLVCLAGPPTEGLPAAAAALTTPETRLVVSWPLGKDGYGLRCFGSAGEAAELPVTLDFHSVLGRFWGLRLNRNRLDIHHLSLRPARLLVELTAEETALTGQTQIVYKAVPTLKELDKAPGGPA